MSNLKHTVSLPLELALLGFLGAVGSLGCGGGEGGEGSDVAGLQAGSPSSSGAKDVCRDSTLLDRAPNLPKPTGTAHFKPIPATEDEPERDLVEITCEVLRNQAGEVAGFYASFFTEFQESFLSDMAAVKWKGKFAGPGEYEDAEVVFAYENDISDSGARGSLVIEADGLTGKFTSPRAELEFKCGNASKLSLQTVPWPPQPERTLRAVANDGIVYEFPALECGTDNGNFEIGAVGEPFWYRVRADGTGTGSHRTTSNSTDYAGGAFKGSSSGGAMLTLNCGASPVTGTINNNVTFVCGK